jgi:hypothetical protein
MATNFYHPKITDTGWHKGLPAHTRRFRMLKSHKGDMLATGRALQALANITTDPATKRAARADVKYFFARNAGVKKTVRVIKRSK